MLFARVKASQNLFYVCQLMDKHITCKTSDLQVKLEL